ncbi:hypothetical protein KEM52_006174 [Ascosphaera acerosa]|nr:hypothetical protein KEM52_006174 [Ascosphaera acerosa]
MVARGGYDVVVDVDAEGDLGHTDLQDDLEFHQSGETPSTPVCSVSRLTDRSSSDFNADGHPSQSGTDSRPFISSGDSQHRRGNSTAGRGGGADTDGGPAGGGSSAAASSKIRLWSLNYYAQFFDVDTSDVTARCFHALWPRARFLDVLDGNPDLYGPFWIATTVVVILFLTGTISQYLAFHGKEHFEYDFRLLSGGAGLVYGYTFVVPAALWAAVRWFGRSHAAATAVPDGTSTGTADLIEAWALYGYANLIWIPIALSSWSPLNALNWALVAVGFGWSTFFLVRNLYPVLNATDAKTSKILLVLVILLQGGLCLAIKILFFA